MLEKRLQSWPLVVTRPLLTQTLASTLTLALPWMNKLFTQLVLLGLLPVGLLQTAHSRASNAGVVYFRVTFTVCGGVLFFPWHRHQREGVDSFQCLLQKTLAKWSKHNYQSSEAKCCQQDSNPAPLGRQSCVLTTEPRSIYQHINYHIYL